MDLFADRRTALPLCIPKNAPITIEDLQKATGLSPNSKAPGDDGLPTELYKQYGESILPHLLRVLNLARASQSLSESMTIAKYCTYIEAG